MAENRYPEWRRRYLRLQGALQRAQEELERDRAERPKVGELNTKRFALKREVKKAEKIVADFKNNLRDNVQGGGAIWDFIKSEDFGAATPPTAPGTTPRSASLETETALSTTAGSAIEKLPATGDATIQKMPATGMPTSARIPVDTPEGMFGSEEDITSTYLPDPTGYGGSSTATTGAYKGPGNPKFSKYERDIKAKLNEIRNYGEFTELPPDFSNPKYKNADGTYNHYLYNSDKAQYDQRLSQWQSGLAKIQYEVDSIFGLMDALPPESLTPYQQGQLDATTNALAQNQLQFEATETRFEKEASQALSIHTDMMEIHQEALDIDRIRALVDQGQLALAAQEASDLNLREIRGQTLKFLNEIADNPTALASLMSSEFGQNMLNDLGFGMLASGDTPVDLSRFFVGGTGGMAPETWEQPQLTDAELYGTGEAGNLGALNIAMRQDDQYTETKDSDNPADFLDSEGNPIDPNAAIREQKLAAIRSQSGQRFDTGRVRDPGTLISPNARDWRMIQRAGQTNSMIFEAALAGVNPEELMARIEASRPGVKKQSQRRMFSRGRFN